MTQHGDSVSAPTNNQIVTVKLLNLGICPFLSSGLWLCVALWMVTKVTGGLVALIFKVLLPQKTTRPQNRSRHLHRCVIHTSRNTFMLCKTIDAAVFLRQLLQHVCKTDQSNARVRRRCAQFWPFYRIRKLNFASC